MKSNDITVLYVPSLAFYGATSSTRRMVLSAAKMYDTERNRSRMIGNGWCDIGIASCAGIWQASDGFVREGIGMTGLASLKVKIFADGADLQGMKAMYANPLVKGFTTNPTLMKAAGVADYRDFAGKVLAAIPDRPVSFEVFADEFEDMELQALEIASWGRNVNVKIPVTNTKGIFTGPLVGRLARRGVMVNVTAVFTLDQVRRVAEELIPNVPAIVSMFAGRIADSGIDPVPLMAEAAAILRMRPKAELLWASPREVLNIIQADRVGCGIITVTNDLLKKLSLIGKNQSLYSLETVKMFYSDALSAGYRIEMPATVK